MVSTLLGKTAETLTKSLAAKLTGHPRPAKRRPARKSAKTKRSQVSAPAGAADQKGGLNHG